MNYKRDTQGRLITQLHDVRGALVTCAASLSSGTPTTIAPADADYFHDLVEVTLANNSTVAASVAITNDGSTLRSVIVPANSTIQVKFDAPLPQNTPNTPVLADMEDITGTTVSLGGLFVRKPIK